MGIFLKIVLVFFCLIFTIFFSVVGIVPSMVLSVTPEQVAQQLGIEEVEFDSQAQITQIANQAEAEINSFTNGTIATLTLTNEDLTALIIDFLATEADSSVPELTNVSVNIKDDNGEPGLAFVATLNSDSLPDDMQDLKDIIGDDVEITIGMDVTMETDIYGNVSPVINKVLIGNIDITETAQTQWEDLFDDLVNTSDLGMGSSGIELDVVNGQLTITK